MGIGDGIVATNFEGQYQWKWTKFTYFILKGSYLTGSGEASAKLLDVNNTSVEIGVFGLTGGLSEIFRPYEDISIRGTIEGGFGLSSVSVGVDQDPSSILNDRIDEGTLLMMRAEVSAFYKWKKGYNPMISLNALSLHNSTNLGFSLGVLAEI